MTGVDFFSKVLRLAHYDGAVRGRLLGEVRRAREESGSDDGDVIEGTSASLQAHDAFAGLFEKGGSG